MAHICERVVAAAHYLQANGMTVDHLRALHHSPRNDETFASTFRYFGSNKELKEMNVRYANRLIHVAERHQSVGGHLSSLVREALERWPL
jgi:hypothetical protein